MNLPSVKGAVMFVVGVYASMAALKFVNEKILGGKLPGI